MATASLALNVIDGGAPRVKRYLNATPSELGAGAIPGAALDGVTTLATSICHARNRVVCFSGDEKTFLAVTGANIWRTTDEFATWTNVQALTGIPANQSKTGLHIVDIGGTPTAVVVYIASIGTGSATIRAMKSADGLTWTDSGSSGTLPTGTSGSLVSLTFTDEIAFHNVIYLHETNDALSLDATRVWYYDPGANSFGGIIPINYPGVVERSFVVWLDRLCLIDQSATACVISDLTGGSAVPLTTNFYTSGGHLLTLPGALVDPSTGDLAVFIFTTQPGGTMHCFRVAKDTFAITDVTSDVLTPSLAALGAGAKVRTAYMDVEASISADPTVPPIYVYFSANATPGTLMSMWRWNGFTKRMGEGGDVGVNGIAIDSGGNWAHAIGANPRPIGGQYSYTAGQLRLRIVGRTAVLGGVRYTFTCSSAGGATAVKVRGFYETAITERLSQAATLTNPSHGSMSGVYNIGLTADGTTSYSLTWAAEADGLAQGDRAKFGLDVVAA